MLLFFRSFLLKFIALLFFVSYSADLYAGFEVVNPNTRIYSDQYKIGNGAKLSDSGTIYTYAYMSGSQVVVYVMAKSGSFKQNAVFGVYKGAINDSSRIATSANLKGGSGGYVSFTPSESDYRVMLQTTTTDGTVVSFYINTPFTVTVTAPSSSSLSVSPNPGYVGDQLTFSTSLNGDLPSGYTVKITLADSSGNWTLSEHDMSGSGRNFTYQRIMNEAGQNRQYRVAIFKGSARKTDWYYGTYTVKEKLPEVYSVSPLTGDLNKDQTYTVTGVNLPSSLVFTIADADDCGQTSYNSSSVTFNCIPRLSGSKSYSVKKQSQGDILKTGIINVDSGITGVSVSPISGYAGDQFTFSAILKNDLPSGFSVKITFANASGNWTQAEHDMSGGSRNFSYPRVISEIGQDRQYRVAIFNGNNRKTDWYSGTYTTKAKPIAVSSVSPETGELNKAQTYTVKGSNLPSSLVFTIADADDCRQTSYNSSSVTFNCTPRTSGSKSYSVKKQSQGDVLKTGTINVDSGIAGVSASPTSGYVGNQFTFSTTLKDDLPSGFSVKITFADASGNWTQAEHDMPGGPRNFSYPRVIDTVGQDRYRLASQAF
ncbi:IPT/TIG domain-containing protein [Candidatus Thiothrix anitrata]|uniref:IPT/TIG domain-containing protein n=1 Tax=Candidatus Thiothrix anitrata TaxID=2823902 RepID=A0ABX7WYG4_9GAMM|nr:IPT/TIG domain-containing protein [Candidatus Thiothrix anitrata]QTR48680.1 IPT/TIG domain-containing protein [Candidatus Thiothrix anitrata]